MEIVAVVKNVGLSPQKARLVADVVRGLKVDKALEALTFLRKKGAKLIYKVLKSAIANAEHNSGADIDELKVSTIMVDEATSLKRFAARAKGRGNRIVKRRCHITVKVASATANKQAERA